MAESTRRDFIKRGALGTAAMLVYPPSRVVGANARVRVGMIGVGGRGQELLKQVLGVPNAQLVAIADIYTRSRDEAKRMASGIDTHDPHRRLLDMKDSDAVIVASPLHIHSRRCVVQPAGGTEGSSDKSTTWSVAEADQCLA